MTEAGFLDEGGTIGRKRFARAVTEAPTASRVGKTYSHTYVTRWLNGMTPRDQETRLAIAEALEAGSAASSRRTSSASARQRLPHPTSDSATRTHPTRASRRSPSCWPPTSPTKQRSRRRRRTRRAWSDASMAWLVGAQKPLAHTDGPSRIGLVRRRATAHDADRVRRPRRFLRRRPCARRADPVPPRRAAEAAARRRARRGAPRTVRRGRGDDATGGVDVLRLRAPRTGTALLHPGPRPRRCRRRQDARRRHPRRDVAPGELSSAATARRPTWLAPRGSARRPWTCRS